MGVVGGSKRLFASLKSVGRLNFRKVALFVTLGLSIGVVMFWNQADSVKVANIVGGVSGGSRDSRGRIRVSSAPELLLLPRKTPAGTRHLCRVVDLEHR